MIQKAIKITICNECNGTGKDKKGNKCKKCNGEGGVGTIDNHDTWNKSTGNKKMIEESIKKTVKEAYKNTKKLQGHIPGEIEEAIKQLLKPPTINWKQELKQYIGASIKSGFKASWKRPNRRFANREEFKGKIAKRTIRILNSIDTSGSIDNKDFQDFIVELKGILNIYKCEIDIVQCDAEIQKKEKLYPYSKLNISFKGRGGTSFKPVFDYYNKNPKYDLLIYFTDLYGDESECNSIKPVIWVTTKNYNKNSKPKVGRIVNIK